MKIDIYDSYATSRSGQTLHFDVLVESGTLAEQALTYGRQWLSQQGEAVDSLQQNRCQFCHSEAARPDVAAQIQQHGFYILPLDGCPPAV